MRKVIGMDLGDKRHVTVVFDETGEEVETGKINNTATQIRRYFRKYQEAVVVMEAGTHSSWIERLLREMGHEVWVGDPRRLRVIWDSNDKSDERDARVLGLMYRLEPRLLHRVFHRGEQAQGDLELIKARDQLVSCRSKLVNHVRGVVKTMGGRIPKCSAASFHRRAPSHLPPALSEALGGILVTIEELTKQIVQQDKLIELLSESRYPETSWLRQVPGVGPITALAYVLSLEDPHRLSKSREAGPLLGLTPRRDQSGQSDKQLPITKAGNAHLRRLLVNCAQYILGPLAPQSDLRRYGEKIAERGGKNAKKRAVVAVARKLAVLLHRLWVDESEYIALRSAPREAA